MAEEPDGEEDEIENVFAPAPIPADAAAAVLPETASALPLTGMAGALSLAAGLALWQVARAKRRGAHRV